MSGPAWLAFAAAAAVGAPARYLLEGWIGARRRAERWWGTFVVNVTGGFALGLLTGLGLHHGLSPTTRTVVGTGGLGAYTTFSTLSFETVRLAEEGRPVTAGVNAVGSVTAGALAAALGLLLTH